MKDLQELRYNLFLRKGDPSLSQAESQMLISLTVTSSSFSPYILRETGKSYLALYARLFFAPNLPEYRHAAEEISEKLPGVGVFFGVDITQENHGIMVCIPPDLCSEADEIISFSENILLKHVQLGLIENQPKDFLPFAPKEKDSSDTSSDNGDPPSLLSDSLPPNTQVFEAHAQFSRWELQGKDLTHILKVELDHNGQELIFGEYSLNGAACELWCRGLVEVFGSSTHTSRFYLSESVASKPIKIALDGDGRITAIAGIRWAGTTKWFVPGNGLKRTFDAFMARNPFPGDLKEKLKEKGRSTNQC